MRISTSTLYDSSVATINDQTSALLKIQQQLASGRRILAPADDPVAAARAFEVSQSSKVNDQYLTNQKAANSSLGLEESVLASVQNTLQAVHSLAVDAGNPTYDNTNRGYIATELRSKFNELVGQANTTDGAGLYLFSGYKGATLPFTVTASGGSNIVNYNGDQGQRLMQIASSRQIAVSDAGSSVFTNIKDGNGTFTAAPGAANAGTGIIGPGNVLDPSKWAANATSKDYTIQFRNIATVVPSPGGTNEVTITDTATWENSAKNFTVTFGVGTYTVTDNVHSITSGPFSYTGNPTNISGVGASFNWAPAAGSSYTITPGTTSYDIIDNVSGNSVITGAAPPATGNYPRTYTSGQAIDFSNLAVPVANSDYGIQATITGSPASGDGFTVKASTNEGIFKTIDDLASALEAPVNNDADGAKLQNALNKALTNINNDMDSISTVRASIGARMKEISSSQSSGQDLTLQYQTTLSGLQDLDYAKAVSQLTQQKVNLEAAQKAFTQIAGLSLFNYM